MLLLALAAGLARGGDGDGHPVVDGSYTPKVQWTLSVVILGGWWGLRGGGARSGRVAAADAGESARSHAGRRLLHSRARRDAGKKRWAM